MGVFWTKVVYNQNPYFYTLEIWNEDLKKKIFNLIRALKDKLFTDIYFGVAPSTEFVIEKNNKYFKLKFYN